MLKASSTTTDKDLGHDALLRELGKMAGTAYADVGLLEGEGTQLHEAPSGEKSELTLAQIGAVHEFGSSDGRIPQRSWLRSNHDAHLGKYQARLERDYGRFLSALGAIPMGALLTAFAEQVASDVRRTITALKSPPKAPATLRREGERFTNPLIWTGAMRAAVRGRVRVSGRTVGAT